MYELHALRIRKEKNATHRNAALKNTQHTRVYVTYQAGARHHCCPLTTANRYQPRYFFTLSHTYISEIPIEIGSSLSLSL